jgi:hypothetical protein
VTLDFELVAHVVLLSSSHQVSIQGGAEVATAECRQLVRQAPESGLRAAPLGGEHLFS